MKFMVFDVESVGLFGEGFAVGWVVVDDDMPGRTFGEAIYSCPCSAVTVDGLSNDDTTWKWLTENIPDLPVTHSMPTEIRSAFWNDWAKRRADTVLVADCGWPVEARFLMDCVRDVPIRRMQSPYPFIDLNGVLLARGVDPVRIFDRLPNELPAHNPLNDARQTARILLNHPPATAITNKDV